MPRSVLVMAGLLAVLLGGAPAAASDNGLTVLAAPPASQGRTRLQVEVTAPSLQPELRRGASADRFRVSVEGAGAQVTGVSRMADSQEGRYTVLAFDQSKSFAPYWPLAFQLARTYVGALGPRVRGQRVAVMTFGKDKDTHCVDSNPSKLEACLDKVKQLGTDQLITRLKFYVQEAVREAALAQPLAQGGSREVIVFTDAGEESAALDVKELAREARDKGVRIHTVVFSGSRTGKGLAQRLDEMSQLAEGSGGRYIQVQGLTTEAAAPSLRSLAEAVENLYWLEVSFCGVKPGQTSDRLSVQALAKGQAVAWSGDVSFRQSDEGGATRACPNTVTQGTSSTSPSTGTPTGTSPANPPTVNPSTGTPEPTTPPGTEPISSQASRKVPWWGVLLFLLLLGGLVVWLLSRRRSEPAPTPVARAQPPAVPVPAVEPAPPVSTPHVTQVEPAPAVWKDPFATLPETRLMVTQGPAGLEPFYRVHKATFTIGARTGEMDLAVNLPQLSGHHATVQLFKNGNVFVQDNQSTNGTFVEGRRLQPGERVQVKPGQRIRLSQHLELTLNQPGLQPSADPASGGVPLVEAPPSQPAVPAPAQPSRPKDRTLFSPARGDDE